MKYKKVLILVTCLIFVTALIYSFFSAFRTAEITLTATGVENSSERVLDKSKSALKEYYGKNLVFISVDDITQKVSKASPYAQIVKVSKKYPNQIFINVKERREAFAVKVNEDYYVLDDGLYCVSKKADNLNNVDGFENILLNVNVADYANNALLVNKTFKFNDGTTNDYFSSLIPIILNNRQSIYSIDVCVRSDGVFNRTLVFKMREGMVIQIDKADELSQQKFNKLIEYYNSASNKGDGVVRYIRQLTTGEIVCS